MTHPVHILLAPTQEIATAYARDNDWRNCEWERIATDYSARGRTFPADRYYDIIVIRPTHDSITHLYGWATAARFNDALTAVHEGRRRTRGPAAEIREVRW